MAVVKQLQVEVAAKEAAAHMQEFKRNLHGCCKQAWSTTDMDGERLAHTPSSMGAGSHSVSIPPGRVPSPRSGRSAGVVAGSECDGDAKSDPR